MRLGVSQSLRTEQRLVQSPQMIQAMQILQTPLLELKDQIDQELQENVFLERKDEEEGEEGRTAEQPQEMPALEDKLQREFAAEIDQLESRLQPTSPRMRPMGNGGSDEEDLKLQALYNTPGPGV